MEGSLRSDGMVKKKGASGCLIVKKKDEESSFKKKKKRERVLLSDSGSSDELLETMRRKVREKVDKRAVKLKRREEGDGNFGGRGEEFEKKSGMDLFEFDEYDEFEGFTVGNDYSDGDNELRGSKRGGSSRTPEEPIRPQRKISVLKVTVNSSDSSRKKKMKTDLFRDDCEKEHDENKKSSRSEVVRKKENLQLSCRQLKKRKSNVASEKEVCKTRKPLMGKSGADDDLDLDGTDTSLKLDRPGLHTTDVIKEERRSTTKNLCSPRGKERDRLSESITPVRSDKETRFHSESSTPCKGKEGKVMGEGSTDKQHLRETIREMLVEAGWAIDYRPRKNRDYLDAVYIHPGGTAYWSITKAYEALQRQFDDQQGRSKSAGISSSFVPISEDMISKLTRQTRRKIEQKMKKRREDGMPKTTKKTAEEESVDAMDSDQPEETLASYIRQKRKSSKNKTHDLRHESGSESMDYSCKPTTKGDGVEKSLGDTKNRLLQGRLGSVIERCTLRIRDLNKSQNSGSDGYVAYSGKRTVLAWLIDSGIIQSGKKVQYMNHRRTRVRLEGWITKEGIHCGCCSKIVTVPKFELHAGSKLGLPFQNIFLESGVSLLQCQIDAWNKNNGSEHQDFYSVDVDADDPDDDPDDDTCGTCGDGGDLICCDSCPSTYHQSCLEIKIVPCGDWHCPNCVCKFCGAAKPHNAGCDSSGDKLMTCSFCERKYHKLCTTDNGTTPVDSSTRTTQFCGHKCEELYDHVWKNIGVKHELETGFSWSLIRKTNIDSDVANSGFAKRVECNSKLAVARSVLDECFLPIIDRRSGINLIHNVLYNCGANFPRLNYGSFYTAILERGDDIISVACIRIHGTELAEMPFIGTRHIYRRQGMCSRLLSAIESALSSFKVEKLIIPAISEHMSTWTTSFGFSPLEKDLKKEIKSVNMLVFPGTDMLQKRLMKPVTNDAKAIDSNVKHCQPSALTRKSSSLTYCDDEDERKKNKKNLDKFEVDSGSSDSAAPSNITSNPGIQFSAVKTALDQNNQVVESASGSILSSSLSAPSISLFGLGKPVDSLNKDIIQSFMETPKGGQPVGTITSSGEELCAVPKDKEVSDAQILTEMDGNDSVASTADVNIQSTPCEAEMKDHDIADLSFDNVRTDVNGLSSLSEEGNENQRLCVDTDLNKPGVNVNDDVVLVPVAKVATDVEVVGVKSLTNTSLVDGIGNHGDSNAAAASFEHANASANSNASEKMNGQSDFSCSAGGGSINSESCVEQSEMKSETREASTLSCNVNALTTSNISSNAEQDMKYSSVQALPDSSNVGSPHGAIEVQKNQDTISLSAFHGNTQNTVTVGANPVGARDLNSTVISSDDIDPSVLAIHSNGKDKVISDEIVPMKLQPDNMEKAN